jgi:hypothetical protein
MCSAQLVFLNIMADTPKADRGFYDATLYILDTKFNGRDNNQCTKIKY